MERTANQELVNWKNKKRKHLKDDVYPIEVKAEENLRSKSLKAVYGNNPA